MPTTPAPAPRLRRPRWTWILLALLPVLLLVEFSASRRAAPRVANFAYSELRRAIEQGEVHTIRVIDGELAEGELRAAVVRATADGDTITTTRFRTRLPGGIPNTALFEALHAAHVRTQIEHTAGGWTAVLAALLPWLLIFGFWFWMSRRQGGLTGGLGTVGKANSQILITPGDQATTFADVAGCDEAKADLQEIVEFLRNPERFTRLGGRLPKGALLVGPPGTGKTLLAKAVAGEAGRPVIVASASSFVEVLVGVGAARVRDLFAQAREHAPCILFLDELDAIGRQRGAGFGGGHDEREQTLNQLLVEMDGFDGTQGIVVLAATNRPDVLDQALLRPGRLDRQVVVDAPDLAGRVAILRIHAAKLVLDPEVDLERIARQSPGMTGADLANLCNEAALAAGRVARDAVTAADFTHALDKLQLGGPERRSRVLSVEERRLTAVHEAGHTVIGLLTPGADPVHKVTIIPRGRALGVTASYPDQDRFSMPRTWLEGRLAMLCGGRAAEALVFGEGAVTTGASGDIQQVTTLARRMVTLFGMSPVIGLVGVGEGGDAFLGRTLALGRDVSEQMAKDVDLEVRRLVAEAYDRATALLITHRGLLEAITEALLERETLGRDEIEALRATHLATPAFATLAT